MEVPTFTHVLVVSNNPHFFYACSEKEVLDMARHHHDGEVLGVIEAMEGLEIKKVDFSPSLESHSAKQLPEATVGEDGIVEYLEEQKDQEFEQEDIDMMDKCLDNVNKSKEKDS